MVATAARRSSVSRPDSILEHTSSFGGIGRGVGVAGVLARLGVQSREIHCGRYRVIEKLGDGGMGSVYRAHDPALGRDIAIKVLHGEASAASRRRLRREAQALARLSHPNVVAVLGVGDEGGETWIAMELIAGQTLADWISENAPALPTQSPRAMALLEDTAWGLIAAHRVGLVHRDIKPANILIGPDHRARVGDFGLAQLEADATTEPRVGGSGGSDGATRFGGTPLYMAPEQHLGAIADERSDQFSFAATAWEVFTGAPPFRGRSLLALAEVKLDGQPAAEVPLPRVLRRTLLRALDPDPQARFESVEALLQALRHATKPTRMRWPIAVVTLGGLSALALTSVGEDRTPCQGLSEPVWDTERSDALKSAFTRDGLVNSGAAWSRVAFAADEYTQAWARTRDVACSRSPVSPQRLACLQRSSRALEDTLSRLSADPKLALNALAAFEALPDPSCEPTDGVLSPQAQQVSLAIAELRILEQSGQAEERRVLLDRVEPMARRLDDPGQLARILDAKGALLVDTGVFEAGVAALEEAYSEALRAGDDAAALSLAADIIDALHRSDASISRTRYWLELGHVAHARLDHAPSIAASWLYIRQADLEWTLEGNAEAATASAERALEIASGLDPTGRRMVYLARAAAEQSLVDIEIDTGRPIEAGAHAEAVVENTRAAFGDGHPQTLDAHYALVGPLLAMHRETEALAALDKAQRGAEILQGARSETTAIIFAERSRVQLLTGDFPGSLASAEACLEILRAIETPPWLLASGLSAHMLALKANGDLDAARATSAELITLIESSMGPDHIDMALAQHNLADLLFETGDFAESIGAYERSLTVAEAGFGDDSPNLAYPLSGLAEAHLVQQEFKLASENIARARALGGPDGLEPAVVARLDWTEARLIRDEDPARAEQLARNALGRYRDAGYAEESANIEAWLDER